MISPVRLCSEFRPPPTRTHLSPRFTHPTHSSASPIQTHFIFAFRHVAHDILFLPAAELGAVLAWEGAGEGRVLSWDRLAELRLSGQGDASLMGQVGGSGRVEVD